MRLYILRHAEAEEHSSSDFGRVLTPKGRDQAKTIGQFLKKQEIRPDVVLSSPYLRSWQTAEEVCAEAGLEAPVREPLLGCGMTAEMGLGILKACEAQFPSLLLVGHQPDLGEFMDLLLGTTMGKGGGNVHVRKSSLAGFWVHSLREGGGVLEFFLPVRFLK